MKTQVKYNFIAFLAVVFLLLCLLVGAGMPSTVARAAEGIDYASLEYISIPGDVDYKTDKVVVRFHCPSIRHIGDEDGYIEDFRDYISYLSFKESMGCQIYFVDGIACALEGAEDADNPTTEYADYYEIKYYDSENKYVYITFKNLTEFVENNIGSYDEGVYIKGHKRETYTESVKLAYLPEDGTDAPAEDGTDAPAEDGTDAPAEDGTDAPAEDGTNAPAEDGNLFAWLEWWHIAICVYCVVGVVIGIIWKVKTR